MPLVLMTERRSLAALNQNKHQPKKSPALLKNPVHAHVTAAAGFLPRKAHSLNLHTKKNPAQNYEAFKKKEKKRENEYVRTHTTWSFYQ